MADFTSRGIDAVNFGPGATRYAHRRDERVEIEALERAYACALGVRHGYRLTVPVSPSLERQTTYPFVALNEAAGQGQRVRIEVLDFGMGDHPRGRPRGSSRPSSRLAARPDGLPGRSRPARAARGIAAWAERRLGTRSIPGTEIIPTLGSKEAIFTLRAGGRGRGRTRDTVAYTDLGYPVYERGRCSAARPPLLPLRESHGFLPDLDAIDEETWARLAVFWINYPNNPTGATAPLSFYELLAACAREHGSSIASDEAYAELCFEEPPASASSWPTRTASSPSTRSRSAAR